MRYCSKPAATDGRFINAQFIIHRCCLVATGLSTVGGAHPPIVLPRGCGTAQTIWRRCRWRLSGRYDEVIAVVVAQDEDFLIVIRHLEQHCRSAEKRVRPASSRRGNAGGGHSRSHVQEKCDRRLEVFS